MIRSFALVLSFALGSAFAAASGAAELSDAVEPIADYSGVEQSDEITEVDRDVFRQPIRFATPKYSRMGIANCTGSEGYSRLLPQGTRGPVVYNDLKSERRYACSVDVGPALVSVADLAFVLVRVADNSVTWEVPVRLCYHDTAKDVTACGADASTAESTDNGIYHYELVPASPPEGEWTVGYTTAWLELRLTEVAPNDVIKAGVHSFTVWGY